MGESIREYLAWTERMGEEISRDRLREEERRRRFSEEWQRVLREGGRLNPAAWEESSDE